MFFCCRTSDFEYQFKLLDMRKFILIFAALFTAFAFSANAQMDQQLPNDPAVRKGKLENGMTYYIMKNSQLKQTALSFILPPMSVPFRKLLTRTDLRIFWSTCASTEPRISRARQSSTISRASVRHSEAMSMHRAKRGADDVHAEQHSACTSYSH